MRAPTRPACSGRCRLVGRGGAAPGPDPGGESRDARNTAEPSAFGGSQWALQLPLIGVQPQ
jgi:hypothetical protein